MLHVVNTCLDVVLSKLVYILVQVVSNIWFIYVCSSLLICTHYMHLYSLVLMIHSFTLVLSIFIFLLHVYVIFCSKLINIHVYPWVICFSCNILLLDSFVFGICMHIVSTNEQWSVNVYESNVAHYLYTYIHKFW